MIFGAPSALAATPVLKIDPVVTAGYTTVEFSGEVDPKGDSVEWYDELSTDGGATWEFGDALGFSEEGTPQLITNAVHHGLAPGTTYRIRLTAFDLDTEELLASPEPSPEFTTKTVAAPSATLDPITISTDSTAVFKASINPNSPGGLDEEDKSLFATSYEFHCTPECPGLSGGTVDAEASGSELEVEAQATELEPNTEYTVTLSATNRGGEATDGPQAFETDTLPLTVSAGTVTPLGGGVTQLAGTLNPHNSAVTSCTFEYGTTSAYGQTAACESAPGAVNHAVFVTASLPGLEPGARYHFRLTAASETGPATSLDATFVVRSASCPNEAIREQQGSIYLPECRAYEQVSPIFKEGFAPGMQGFTDNGRVLYLSTGNYAENGNGIGGVPGGNAYVAGRAEAGWSSEALAPSGPAFFPVPLVPGQAYQGQARPVANSADLRSSIWDMRRGDQPEGVIDLYLRSPDGSFTRIGPASDQTTLSNSGGNTLVASADLSHVVYNAESGEMYEYLGTSGQRRSVSIDNDGHSLLSKPGCVNARLGFGGLNMGGYHAISADGHVIFLACESENGVVVSEDVYARVDGTTTVAVSGSQCDRAPSDPGGTCNGHSSATFAGANAGGTRVYFTTAQQLVDGDTDETNDLYECAISASAPAPVGAVNPCPELREVSGTATGANVRSVVRISDDGSRAYFIATGVLASNLGANGEPASSGNQNLYVWTRDAADPSGEMRFVAKLGASEGGVVASGGFSPGMAETTDDGRYLLFATYAQLIDSGPQADTDHARDLYRYDAETGALTRLTTDSDGTGGNQAGKDATITPLGYGPKLASLPVPRGAMSDDGRSVVFTTDEALAPRDRNETIDTYLWHDGQVSLISGGAPSQDQKFTLGLASPFGASVPIIQAVIAPSGRDVYFTTTAQLVAGDVDTVMDIYDARIEGGFDLSQAPGCTGESCRTSSSPSSPIASAATTGGAGPGNPAPRKSCAKGKVRKHGRCVKKQAKKKHRHGKKSHHREHHAPDHRSTGKGGRR